MTSWTLWHLSSNWHFKSHFPCTATMLRQFSRLIGLYFVCYCMPVSSTGLAIHNSLLNGHVFKTFVGIDWLSCAQECDKEDMCFSYNYFSSGEICELNNAGLKDPCNNADNRLIRSTGWIYHEIDALQVNIQSFMQLSRFNDLAWNNVTLISRLFLAFLRPFSKIRWKIYSRRSVPNIFFIFGFIYLEGKMTTRLFSDMSVYQLVLYLFNFCPFLHWQCVMKLFLWFLI